MNSKLWLMAAVVILAFAGLVTISPENRWWWFILVIPAFVAIWLLRDRAKKS